MIPEPSKAQEAAAELAGFIGREKGGEILAQARSIVFQGTSKTGIQTSEFKMSVLGVVTGLILLIVGNSQGNQALMDQSLDLIQWSIAGYAVARGAAKVANK